MQCNCILDYNCLLVKKKKKQKRKEKGIKKQELCLILSRCTGCPKKNALLCLTGCRGHQEWTRDKSSVKDAHPPCEKA